jgi:hypothetical protein
MSEGSFRRIAARTTEGDPGAGSGCADGVAAPTPSASESGRRVACRLTKRNLVRGGSSEAVPSDGGVGVAPEGRAEAGEAADEGRSVVGASPSLGRVVGCGGIFPMYARLPDTISFSEVVWVNITT